MNYPIIEWPEKARVVVALTIAFERWKSGFVEPSRITGPTIPAGAKVERDLGALSWTEYEGRAGLPRIMRILKEYDVHATAIMNAMGVERYPEVCRQFAETGNEVCAHSYTQDTRMWSLNKEEERENIRNCREILRKLTGFNPVGWLSPGGQPSENTAELLAEQGFLYYSDMADDDLPYLINTPKGEILALPYDFEINDMQLYGRGFNPPSIYYNFFCDKFDMLYQEGATTPKLLNFTIHSRLFGRPGGAMALVRCLKYAKGHPRVWIARRMDIAQYWLDRVKGKKS
jgi:peptidoglycan/xylan/chitin deacetylase (PgdA/CDA1 family)